MQINICKVSTLTVLLITVMPAACSQKPAAFLTAARAGFEISNEHNLQVNQSSREGFMAVDAASGRLLLEKNGRAEFMPASTAKLFTTLAALELYGEERTFNTRIAFAGRISDGVLKGNLYLQGQGDPLFNYGEVYTMVNSLREAGIKRLEGRLIVDDAYFTSAREITAEMDEDASYNTGVGALSVNFSLQQASWRDDNYSRNIHPWEKKEDKDKAASLVMTPPVGYNQVAVVDTDDSENFIYKVQGDQMPRGYWLVNPAFFDSPRNRWRSSYNLPVKDPALFTGMVLRHMSAIQGIELPAPEHGAMPAGKVTVLHTEESAVLKKIVRVNLLYSNNMVSETLLLHVGRALGMKKPDIKQAAWLLEQYWRQKLPDVDWSGFRLANGSGLTAKSRISPLQMTALLHHAWQTRPEFFGTLPVSGWSGSLSKRFWTEDEFLRVHAKTGTIFYGLGLSGLYYSKEGRAVIFTYFVSDFSLREILDNPEHPLSEAMDRQAGGWIGRHKKILDHRISHWIAGDFRKDS